MFLRPTADEPFSAAKSHRALLDKLAQVLVGDDVPPRIGRFRVVRRLGRGALGEVFVARDERLDRTVALELWRREAEAPSTRASFERDAGAMARLSHPNLARVFEIGDLDGAPYVVTEFVDGVTLDAWLGESVRSLAEIVSAFVSAGRGLAAAHAAGVVHREFGPDKVTIGAHGRVLVRDFALARTNADARDDRRDQYDFCVALWTAVHGQAPDVAEGRSSPRWLRRALTRGLAREPERRWTSLDELLDALSAGLERRRWLPGGLSLG